jgi:hypothetical protein
MRIAGLLVAMAIATIPVQAEGEVVTLVEMDEEMLAALILEDPSLSAEPTTDGEAPQDPLGTIGKCDSMESKACVTACLKAGTGGGPTAPTWPQVLVSGGCYREYTTTQGLTFIATWCACTWRDAYNREITGGGCDGVYNCGG